MRKPLVFRVHRAGIAESNSPREVTARRESETLLWKSKQKLLSSEPALLQNELRPP
jgi:hypothetical protein